MCESNTVSFGRRGDHPPRLRFKTGHATCPASGSWRLPIPWHGQFPKLRNASAISVHGSDSRLIPPARMTPASSGICPVPCSPLLRGVRPHVSLSGALPPAFASWGILPRLSYGWHLLLRETTWVTSFLTFVLRVRRATLSPGFRGGEPGSHIKMPSPKPCPFGPSRYSSARWFFLTRVPPCVRCLPIDACFQG